MNDKKLADMTLWVVAPLFTLILMWVTQKYFELDIPNYCFYIVIALLILALWMFFSKVHSIENSK